MDTQSYTDPEKVKQMWRDLFAIWYERYGTDSIRTYKIAAMAQEVGLPFSPPENTQSTASEGKLPNLVQLGMIMRRKHRHVHSGLRLICDRVEQGWSEDTPRSTYHLEPKDEPRHKTVTVLSGFRLLVPESDEDDPNAPTTPPRPYVTSQDKPALPPVYEDDDPEVLEFLRTHADEVIKPKMEPDPTNAGLTEPAPPPEQPTFTYRGKIEGWE